MAVLLHYARELSSVCLVPETPAVDVHDGD